MADIAALRDACVLYPAQLRDLFLSLASAGLFRPRWSDMVHEEWVSSVLANRPDLTRVQLEKTRDVMNQAFPDAVVRGFKRLIPTLKLPDPKDRHVLAAAIHSDAQFIVTINLKDFPQTALMPHGVDVIHPDKFVEHLFDLDQDKALAAVARMRSRLRAPSISPRKFIESIDRAGLTLTASRLRANAGRI